MKKVILIISSKGFQQVEYLDTKEELERVGIEVITASDKIVNAIGKDGLTTAMIDLIVSEIKVDDYDGLYLIGGPGAMDYLDNDQTYTLLNKWKESGKPYGAICISTRILAKAGVLQNVQATGWNGDDELPAILVENGADYMEESVFTDGNITTASGPQVAHEFGKEIVKVIL